MLFKLEYITDSIPMAIIKIGVGRGGGNSIPPCRKFGEIININEILVFLPLKSGNSRKNKWLKWAYICPFNPLFATNFID
jgi:hypothetical protein